MKDQKVAPLDDVPTPAAAPTKTDLPVITDPAAFAPPSGTSSPAGDGTPEDDRAGVARLGDPVAVWPCAGCGRPVPQPVRGARTVRYCQDNDGECEIAARESRERGLSAPGLTGQVAVTWEMVERLEGAADRLAGSLASELSVAGVERRVADARAEAAGHVAAAQRERDASERRAEAALRETSTARARSEAAEQEAASVRAEAARLAAELDAARREHRETQDRSDAAIAARLAAERDRDRVASREGELLASLESARAELVSLHGRLSEADTLTEGQRVELDAAQRTADDLRSAVRDAEAKRGQAVADRDQIQARAREFEQHNWQLSRTADELRAAVRALTAERDAARVEADRARRRVDALTAPVDGRRPDAPRPPVDREPLTGLHALPPLNGSPLNGGDPSATDPRANSYGAVPPTRNGRHLPYAG
ncbi:chromosome segregation ATPase [Actinomadura syzygii]|uniref:Chromosome segregation ATPase n=1 Tax=Actinomadura syzygii TaxID=1427538 RepID=A0A5D0TSV4_9ACTN|nr:chromosome segregation ATPase [Actinomadura syzygii]TYC08520.1 chromosome segregation ATPase [Actinomadura syzygii]